MRVLILTQWYPPEPARLPEELATSLRDLGHEVEVLTGIPNYPSGVVYRPYRVRLWQHDLLRDIPIHRVFLYPSHSRSSVGRVLNYLSFALCAGVLGAMRIRRCDVVYAYGTPVTIVAAAWFISRIWRIPYVVSVPDLWPEALLTFGIRNSLVLAVARRFSMWAYRSAARVIAVSSGFARLLAAKGIPTDRIRTIPFWVDIELYRPVPPDDEMRRRLDVKHKTVIMYAGTIGKAQQLEIVVDAANELRHRADIVFVFVGGGVSRRSLEERVQRAQLTNVRFAGPFPVEDMARVYGTASALLLHLGDIPALRMWIPHKLFAYFASGKPVICAVAGESAEIVRAAKAGLVCDPGQPRLLAEVVRRCADMPPAELEIMGKNGRALAETEYHLQRLVRKNADVLTDAVRGAASR